jgi:hypothetical protein
MTEPTTENVETVETETVETVTPSGFHTFSPEQLDAVKNSAHPVIAMMRDAFLATVAKRDETATQLSAVATAKSAAAKQIEESEHAKAVEYRALVAKDTAKRDKLKAELDAIVAEFNAKHAKDNENRRAAVQAAKSEAIAAVGADAAAELDVETAAQEYAAMTAAIQATAKLFTGQDKSLNLDFAKRTVTALVDGKKSSAGKGTGEQWRPRFSSITVNGNEIPTTVDEKGNVQGRNLTGACKVIGISPAGGTKLLQEKILQESGTRDLPAGTTYSFTLTVNEAEVPVTVTTPAAE